jgi:NDP-sugar pyrophosphorylase family protein
VKPITFIICAAGAGTRMFDISTKIPKPMLKLKNKSLLFWSIESLNLRSGDQLIVIHRFNSDIESIEAEIQKKYIDVKIQFVKINVLTTGQAETAFHAKDYILNDDLVIYNSDTYFESKNLRLVIDSNKFDAVIPCFKTLGNSWSFFKTENNSMNVTQVAEKHRISDWCSVGYYHFKKSDYFFKIYEDFFSNNSGSEKYIAPMYNKLVADGKKVQVIECELFKPMGTPEQIQKYWNLSLDDIRHENI